MNPFGEMLVKIGHPIRTVWVNSVALRTGIGHGMQ